MFLKVKVHPSSKHDKVIQKSSDSFEVFVRAKPIDGKANEAFLKSLAEFLKISRSRIRLIRGSSSPKKIIELLK